MTSANAVEAAPFARLVDDFCASEWRFHPVDASFAGASAYDDAMPDPGDATRERDALATFLDRLATMPVPDAAGARVDAQLLRAHATHRLRLLDERPLAHAPPWYTGEAAFGLIAPLLASETDGVPDATVEAARLRAVTARLRALPEFLHAGSETLRDRPTPAAWVARATSEVATLSAFVQTDLARHPVGAHVSEDDRRRSIEALATFGAAIAGLPDASPACGRDLLAFLIADVHGLTETPESLDARAASAFAEAAEECARAASLVESGADWRELVARTPADTVDEAGAPDAYRAWHERAMRDAASLVTPADEYGLAFRPLPAWARGVAAGLYFLSYRSPAAFAPGNGSVYWTAPGSQSLSAVKMVHAVHHGSIGHHTQNARARASESRLARVAGTDAASGIAMLSAGTLVEGWACYVDGLLLDAPDFYTPHERFLVTYGRLRNIASVLVDVRVHTGRWSLAEARAFYRDEAAFAPTRVDAETTRNSLFPASRLMYWTGTQQIEHLRRTFDGSAKAFHDRLLSFGAAPVAWIAEEMAR